jgi:biotin transport system substrate-specific component
VSDTNRWKPAALWSFAGALAIALGAQVSIPMVPVPTTLQTLAVVAVGLLGGPRVGGAAAALYLVLALLGLPILADGASHGGRAFLDLKSAGYVVGFIPGAAVAGWLGHDQSLVRAAGAGVVAHAAVLGVGVPVLAGHIGIAAAIEHGLVPFLFGAAVKGVGAAGLVYAIDRVRAQ